MFCQSDLRLYRHTTWCVWHDLLSVITRWQHKPVAQSPAKPMSVADDYFCFLSVHMSFATFCTLAPSCLGLFTMEIFHSQPSENF